jgi:hypothetical protein
MPRYALIVKEANRNTQNISQDQSALAMSRMSIQTAIPRKKAESVVFAIAKLSEWRFARSSESSAMLESILPKVSQFRQERSVGAGGG